MPVLRNGAFLCRESGTHFVYSNDAIGGSCVLDHHMLDHHTVEKLSIRFGIFSAAGGPVPNCNKSASLLWQLDGPCSSARLKIA